MKATRMMQGKRLWVWGTVLAILAIGLFSSPSGAQEMMLNPGKPGENPLAFSLESSYLGGGPGGVTSFEKGQVYFPVMTDQENRAGLFVRGHRLRLGEDVRIQDRGFEVPEEIGSLDVGATYTHDWESGESLGASAFYGASGSRLLDNQDRREVGATMSYRTREQAGGAWIYLLNYSNNRTFLNNIPLPGIAYSYSPTPSFRAIVGVPFIFVFTQIPTGVFSTFLLSPGGINTEVATFIVMPFQVYGGWSWNARVYQNIIASQDERLLYENKELNFGVRMMLGRASRASLGYTYQYQRSFFIGESIFSRNSDRAFASDLSGVTAKLSLSF